MPTPPREITLCVSDFFPSASDIPIIEGAVIAAPNPRRKVIVSKTSGVVKSFKVRIASNPAAVIVNPCVIKSIFLRSKISARVPPGIAKITIGSAPIANTKDTISGEGESDVISHCPPVSCIEVPIFDVTVAIQSARNIGIESGLIFVRFILFTKVCLSYQSIQQLHEPQERDFL